MIIKKIIAFIIILSISIIIFLFSSQNGIESKKTSEIFSNFAMKKIITNKNNNISNIEIKTSNIIRKTAHFSIYTLLGFFIMLYINCYKIKKNIKLIICFSMGFLYAAFDEFHQYYIPGRSAEIRDVFIDFLGIIFGILLAIFILKIIGRRKSV